MNSKIRGKRISDKIVFVVYFGYSKGKSVNELAEKYSLSKRTICNIISRAEKENRLFYTPIPGHKKKVTELEERSIIKKEFENPFISARRVANELQRDIGSTLSYETVRKIFKRNNYMSVAARKKALLSRSNIAKRLSFAREHVLCSESFWESVIFCEETKIMLYYNEGPSRVWRKPPESFKNENIIPTVKFG